MNQSMFLLPTIFVGSLGIAAGEAQTPAETVRGRIGDAREVHQERPGNAPAPRPAATPVHTGPWRQGEFGSVQVNVNALGQNIPGDAANEPSIAIDPTNPDRIIIGWRQFDNVASNFRQAGWGYSHDGGQSWTFPGVLEPGVFGSDPVVEADADGNFYYYSLQPDRGPAPWACYIYKSFDGGVTWPQERYARGGDKAWITVDRTGGVGRGNVYAAWNRSFSCCDGQFTRSTDGGLSFLEPVIIEESPFWGTMAVGPDGELYISSATQVVLRSNDAQNPGVVPSFGAPMFANLGGSVSSNRGPNPGGLLGQVWIDCDRSGGPNRGNVYVLASVDPFGPDPLDVMFTRSTDGGETWSTPVRINDDPAGNGAWQWFGTMAVAPGGRIDVIWNDTRADPTVTFSQLYHSSSHDAGLTWTLNEPLSPPFNHFLGYPNQNKLGDYYDMVSTDAAAHIAYAATFNGEQDVYFLRISLDCNGNGVPDNEDIAAGTSADCTGNGLPDECESDCNSNGTADSCDIAGGTSQDCTADGVPDECEPDCNTNSVADSCDIAAGTSADCNFDGVPNECEPDCNSNGFPDACDLAGGPPNHNCCEDGHGAGCSDPAIAACVCAVDSFCCQVTWDLPCVEHVTEFNCGSCQGPSVSQDCNGNDIPDECDVADGTSLDCDGNTTPDECQPDCNANAVADACDIAAGTSEDCDGNGQPDECQPDCNANQVADVCDIASGSSADCDANGVPDDCQPDCNANQVADVCDIAAGTSGDCQENATPDECEIAGGTSRDCNENGSPDECELVGADCNSNAVPDDCDLAFGTSGDCNVNGLPDDCDIAAPNLIYDCNADAVPDGCNIASGASGDCNANTIPDECDATVCYPVWDGFEPAPPFAVGSTIHNLDYNGDGTAWDNPTLSATIGNQGCPSSTGKALKSVASIPPTFDYATSENFRGPNDGAPIQALSFDVRAEAQLGPRIDWQLLIRDGSNDADVVLIHIASTRSNFAGVTSAQGGNGRGRVLVQNPAGSPTFINSGHVLIPNACFKITVELDNTAPASQAVRVFVNGTLRATLARLGGGATRIDYLRLQQVPNGAVAPDQANRLALDNFMLCQTGAALAPNGVPDCNGNAVWDACDISSGTSADSNGNGTPDECEGAPAATLTSAVSRKTCDLALPLNPGVGSEPRQGGVTEVRVGFDVAPGGPGPNPVTLEEKVCPPPGTYGPYTGVAQMAASVLANELVLVFTPALENARTYRLNIAPTVTSIAGQFVEVRGLEGDVNSSGRVNGTDRSLVVATWTSSGHSCATDVNASGTTNAADRSLVVVAWTSPDRCAP